MSDHTPVPVAVVGAGNMGSNHIRVYDELPGANLVGVVEPDPDRAKKIGDEYQAPVVDRVTDLEGARAATVAVPNRFHQEVAETCIDNGMDVLVEKPLASTIEEANAIVDAAEEEGAILQVGHIERFNPAVQALRQILADEELISLEAHRLGPFNDHLIDESVVYDLMIHDLDVIDSLVERPISHVDAIGITPRSEEIDHATAHFSFGGMVVGAVTASHVTHGKIRRLDVTTKDAFIRLNYQEQHLEIQNRGTEETLSLGGQSGYRTETVMETPYIQTREPLKNELEHFLECVQTRSTPNVSGNDGIKAVKLASRVVETIRSND